MLAAIAAGGWQRYAPKPPPAAAPSRSVKASCDMRAVLSQCSDYAEPAFAGGEKFLKEPCGVLKGAFESKSCSTEKRVGTCSFGSAEARHYYADGPNAYTVDTATRDCTTSEGKFVPTK